MSIRLLGLLLTAAALPASRRRAGKRPAGLPRSRRGHADLVCSPALLRTTAWKRDMFTSSVDRPARAAAGGGAESPRISVKPTGGACARRARRPRRPVPALPGCGSSRGAGARGDPRGGHGRGHQRGRAGGCGSGPGGERRVETLDATWSWRWKAPWPWCERRAAPSWSAGILQSWTPRR